MRNAWMNESCDILDHFFEVQTKPLVFFMQQHKGNFYVSLKLSKSCFVVNFINILHVRFLYKSALRSFL